MNDMVLTIPEIILRLGIAMLFGGAIGFERQYKKALCQMMLVKRNLRIIGDQVDQFLLIFFS